jgi:hypothetical protein
MEGRMGVPGPLDWREKGWGLAGSDQGKVWEVVVAGILAREAVDRE